MNPATQRVLTALAHERPDRIPVYDKFWNETAKRYRKELDVPDGQSLDEYFGIDIVIVVPDETPFFSRARKLEDRPSEAIRLDGWGRTLRVPKEGYFSETLDVAIKDRRDLERVTFDPPGADVRYARCLASLEQSRERFCCFTKTGGPFLRTCYLRGEEEFLMDIAADPGFARALADRTADHLIQIGLESLRRFDLYETGVWIFDDMCQNDRPMFSPASFEEVFLPAYRRMVAAWKNAGARHVILHCDGNLEPLLDMLIEAGVDGINPVEPKAGMDLARLKARYDTRLALVGGMCNARVLPSGDLERIRREAMRIIDAGRDGGVVIGAHSIGPDVSAETYRFYHDLVEDRGRYE